MNVNELASFCVQVLERIKDPLQTLVSRDHFETAYAVLAHFLLIAQRAPILFSQVPLVPLQTCNARSIATSSGFPQLHVIHCPIGAKVHTSWVV